MNKTQGFKNFFTELYKGEAVRIDTGNLDDFIEVTFDCMKSDNTCKIVFRLSENVVVRKKVTRKVRTL